jgi:hypothetical protein
MTVGRKALRALALTAATSGFVADWNRTHLFNLAWPPHARFHDAMTIALGTGLGGSALYLLRDGADRREVAVGAALPALFWASMGAAFAFPGTVGLEAELPQYVPRVGGVWVNERFPSFLMTAAASAAYAHGAPGHRPRDAREHARCVIAPSPNSSPVRHREAAGSA